MFLTHKPEMLASDKNGPLNGHGSFKLPNGTRMYCTHENGKVVGQGEKYYSDGSVYKGDLGHDGRPHGNGVWVLPDGSRYEGEHDMGFRHGKGVLILPDGTCQAGRFDKDNYIGPEDEPSLMASQAEENMNA